MSEDSEEMKLGHCFWVHLILVGLWSSFGLGSGLSLVHLQRRDYGSSHHDLRLPAFARNQWEGG